MKQRIFVFTNLNENEVALSEDAIWGVTINPKDNSGEILLNGGSMSVKVSLETAKTLREDWMASHKEAWGV